MDRPDPHESFKHHVIKRRDERSIYLGREGTWIFGCTIAISDGGQIVVFGDFGPMVFSHYDAPLEGRIAWMGSHPEADSYVVEKANIGMSNFRRAMTVATAEDFEADVRAAFRDKMAELFDPSPEYTRLAPALTWEAFRNDYDVWVNDEDFGPSADPGQRALDGYLQSIGYEDNWEWIGGLGERPIPEIGLAHAALRRAHELLVDEEVARVEAMTEEELRADCIARGTTFEAEAEYMRGAHREGDSTCERSGSMTIENKIKRVRELDSLQRYDPYGRVEGDCVAVEFDEDRNGDWVRFEDADVLTKLAPELADECERLRDRVVLLEGEMNIENPSKYKTALEEAFDDCSKLIDGNDRWEYAGQMVRAVQSVVEERDGAVAKANRFSGLQQIRWNQRAVKAEATIVELRAGLEAFKAKQVDLLAKAYDEGRNYVDDRGSEE